jgi:hypothetical protein
MACSFFVIYRRFPTGSEQFEEDQCPGCFLESLEIVRSSLDQITAQNLRFPLRLTTKLILAPTKQNHPA